jgi:hypothetical protein
MRDCFVCMPLIKEFQDVYSAIAKEIQEALGGQWKCSRADETSQPGMAAEKVIRSLLNSHLVIAVVADLREANSINPNVMYELGIAHSFRKPTIVVADKENELPFDIRPMETIQIDFSSPTFHADLQRLLQRALRSPQVVENLEKRRIASNPITSQLKGTRIFVEDLPWLWGYCEVLKREREAEVVWEITRDLFWPREALFFESIKEAIRKRRKHYFMVENDEGVLHRVKAIKNELHREFPKADVTELLHFVAIDKNYFVLWPIAIVLYDADSVKKGRGGIICEPMQSQVGDDKYDAVIRDLFEQQDRAGDLVAFEKSVLALDWTIRRQEATFDIALDDRVVDKLATSFVKIWNEKILEESQTKTGDERAALLNNWLIGGLSE